MKQDVLRPPAEILYADELKKLQKSDKGARPPGWKLSPRAVRDFICGTEDGAISRKFYGDDPLIERAIVGLAGNRGLMLVGEPGTAKSMLSELLAAAVSGVSTHSIQGSAGTTEDQIKYSWNYALLLAEGPSKRALVPAPLYRAMSEGAVARFEEITRCPAEIQDVMISVLSDKIMMINELDGDDRVLLARPGFNAIGTANTRDRGVNEMSSAMKRRFNFETVRPIKDLNHEIELVMRESRRLLEGAAADVPLERDIVELLVTTFHDLREGVTSEGIQVDRPTSIMSTAEAVSATMSAGLDAFYFNSGKLGPEHVGRHLASVVLKDNPEDMKKLKQYFDVVVADRSRKRGGAWKEFLKTRKSLG